LNFDEDNGHTEHVEHAEEPWHSQYINIAVDSRQVIQKQLVATLNRLSARIQSRVPPDDTHPVDVFSVGRRTKDDQVKPKPILKQIAPKFTTSPHQKPSARSASLKGPSTSTLRKAVRFDSHLEHVRVFYSVDKPAAVGTHHSPIELDNMDAAAVLGDQKSPHRWELLLPNFPIDTAQRLSLPVRVICVSIVSKYMELVGSIAVSNIVFHKIVTVRYTLDNWNTVSDIHANFSPGFLETDRAHGHDLFKFKISLADQENLDAKALIFCVRYSVNGEEYWDNNNSANFQVNFRETVIPKSQDEGKDILRGFGHGAARGAMNLPVPVAGAIRPIPCHTTDANGSIDKFKLPVNDSFSKIGPFGTRQGTYAQLLPGLDGESFSDRYSFNATLSAAIASSGGCTRDSSHGRTKALPAANTTSSGNTANEHGRRDPTTLVWGTARQSRFSYCGLISEPIDKLLYNTIAC
jgi:hypothetical protein